MADKKTIGERLAAAEVLIEETHAQVGKIWDKLEDQGDVRKDLDGHTKSHWRWTVFFVGFVSAASVAIGLILKYA